MRGKSRVAVLIAVFPVFFAPLIVTTTSGSRSGHIAGVGPDGAVLSGPFSLALTLRLRSAESSVTGPPPRVLMATAKADGDLGTGGINIGTRGTWNPPGTIGIGLVDGNGRRAQFWRSLARIDDQKTHLVVFTRDGTTLTCYVDGVEATVVEQNPGPIDLHAGGMTFDHTAPGAGVEIDSVVWWHRALTTTEVRGLYDPTDG